MEKKIWFITVYPVLINLGIDNAFSTWLDRCFCLAGTLITFSQVAKQ